MYYKAVRVLRNGSRVSQYIGHDESSRSIDVPLGDKPLHRQLSYKLGKWTRAPRGTAGVFCYSSRGAYPGNTNPYFQGKVELYEVEVKGKQKDSIGYYFPRFRAVKLIRLAETRQKTVNRNSWD